MDALSDWAVAVVVPARNEAELIGGCLRSILVSASQCSLACRTYIVVVADSCDDQTAHTARAILRHHGVAIEWQVASVGTARRLGTQAALRELRGHSTTRIWLANTDADTEVPAHWLQRQLEFANQGYQGVAGTVEIGELIHDGRDVSGALMADYAVEADGSHRHVHGANLGVRADAYLQAGGWSHAGLAEDHCLWRRLRESGCALRSSSTLRVKTSARLHARAAGGFGTTLLNKLEQLYV